MNNDNQTAVIPMPPGPEVNPFAERAAQEAAKTKESPTASTLSPEQVPSTEILIVDGGLSLTNIEQVWRTARLIRQSGMAPASFRNDQEIVIAILRALELR